MTLLRADEYLYTYDYHLGLFKLHILEIPFMIN